MTTFVFSSSIYTTDTTATTTTATTTIPTTTTATTTATTATNTAKTTTTTATNTMTTAFTATLAGSSSQRPGGRTLACAVTSDCWLLEPGSGLTCQQAGEEERSCQLQSALQQSCPPCFSWEFCHAANQTCIAPGLPINKTLLLNHFSFRLLFIQF